MSAKGSAVLSALDTIRFRALVADRAGFEVPEARKPEIEQAVVKAGRAIGTTDTELLYEKLAGPEGQHQLQGMIAELAVGETYFFRNQPQFKTLENEILPRLIEHRFPERRLRIWSAACSTGEEPYSVAILLDRLLPDLARWDVTILGTDVNRSSLEKAKEAVYGEWSFRGVPQAIRSNYFSAEDKRFKLDRRIRDMVSFDYLNLVDGIYPSPLRNIENMDLILCRNVLMYFRPPVADDVVRRLHRCLAQRGRLLVGHADMCSALSEVFSAESLSGAVAYKKNRVEPSPASLSSGRPPGPTPSKQRGRKPAPTETPRPAGPKGASESKPFGRGKPTSDAARFEAYRARSDRMDSEAVRKWLEQSLTRNPLFADGHYLMGLILEQEGRLEEALSRYRRCIYADPDYVPGYVAEASVLTHLGLRTRAGRMLDRVVELLRGRDPDEVVQGLEPLTVAALLEELAAYRGDADRADMEGGHR